jgi:hypothetical protein
MASHLTLDQAIEVFESFLLSQFSLIPPRRSHRVVVRTPTFHVGNTGSNPVGDANKIKGFFGG